MAEREREEQGGKTKEVATQHWPAVATADGGKVVAGEGKNRIGGTTILWVVAA